MPIYEFECIKLFKKIMPSSLLKEEEQKKSIIVNYSKKEYVKISDCKKDKWGKINPLPLLTALGNGRGGGDYSGNMRFIGRWAFDEIGIIFDEKELKDFSKITPNFKEGEEKGEELMKENEIVAEKKIKEWLKSDEVQRKLVVENL